MPRRWNRVCATRTPKCPKVLHSKTINVTCPSQHFPLRHVSGWEGPTHKPATSTGYRRCYVEFCMPAENCVHAAGSDTQKRITTVLFASSGWGVGGRSHLEVKSRFDFSCCIWFWLGSPHLKCDTTAILSPRPSSSIRKEFKARTLTFFFPRWKSKVSVPWWYCGTTEVVSGGRPREIPDLLCSNAIDVSPPPASFLTRTLELITNQGRTTLNQHVLETDLDSNGWLTFIFYF